MTLNRRHLGMAAALLPVTALPAFAHGDAHGARGKKPAAKKEQKPWGIAGDARAVTRTVSIEMTDAMRFAPDRLAVRQGETLRLSLRNSGKMMHELVIGTKKELDEHAALMVKFPNMEHDEPYMAHVAPGKTGEIIWHFNRAGEFDFACLIAGHYQAGMVGRITVSAQTAQAAAGPLVQVWKDAQCGCCKDWLSHLQANGFAVRAHDGGNAAARRRAGLPDALGSCHTALVGGYVIEGHVPAADIRRLLRDKPAALGLAVPGMPVGSPGMDGPEYGGRKDRYDVLLVQKDGSTRVYQSHNT